MCNDIGPDGAEQIGLALQVFKYSTQFFEREAFYENI